MKNLKYDSLPFTIANLKKKVYFMKSDIQEG